MRVFLQQWSPLVAALLVVIGVVYTGMTIEKHTERVHERLTIIEKNIESIRNAIEGNQGIAVRIATHDLRVNEKLQDLTVQRDSDIEHNEQESFDVQNAFQALKHNVDTILNMTQRIEYIEEMLLDMQVSIEDMKKQQNKGNQ